MNEKELIKEIKQIRGEIQILKRGKKNYFRRAFERTNILIGVLIGLLLTSAVVFALTKTHTFTSNTPIYASEVNANFDQLFSKVNELENSLGVKYFVANMSADQSLIQFTDIDIHFDTVFVGAAHYDVNWKLTINSPGIYKIIWGMDPYCMSKSTCDFKYFVNGSPFSFAGSSNSFIGTKLLYLETGDWLQFIVYTSGSNGKIFATAKSFIKVLKMN